MAYKIMGTTSSPFYSDMMIYYIMCDTPADLPSTISDIGYGTTIGYGSRADIISDSSKYIWNGSQWVRQTTGGGGGASSADQVSYDNTDSGLTATNVQDAIDEIKDLDDMQDRALAELSEENDNQQLEIDYAINTGSKNILTPTLTSESTKEGVTCTPNPDGTFTLNGTFPTTSSQTNTYFTVVNNTKLQELSDKYGATGVICSGGSDIGHSQGRLRFYKIDTDANTYDSSATNKEIALTLSDNMDSSANISIVVYRGQTFNNVVIKPMIRYEEIKSTAFEPYAPTNRELYELCETKASLNDIYGLKPTIPNGTDLNNLTAGCMTCPGATVAASLLNCPTTTDAFIIYTDYLAAASRVIQRIYSFSTTTGIPAQYMRVRWSQGWTPWYQVMMQSVASASTQSLNSPLLLNREEIAPLETTEIRETEETEETNETEETE